MLKGRNRWQQRKENNNSNNGSNSGSSSPRQSSNQWNNKMANLSLDDNVNTYQNRSPNQAPRFNNQNQGNQGYRPNNNYQKTVPFPSPNVFESMGNYQGGYNNGYQNGYNNQNGYGQRPYNSMYLRTLRHKKVSDLDNLIMYFRGNILFYGETWFGRRPKIAYETCNVTILQLSEFAATI